MIVLIDYDNLPKLRRNSGLIPICNRILDKIERLHMRSREKVHCRFYGGWLRKNKLSKTGNRLLNEAKVGFPYNYSRKGGSVHVVNAELARSLACEQQLYFPHTFRVRSVSENLKVRKFPLNDCSIPSNCPISVVNSLYPYENPVHTDS